MINILFLCTGNSARSILAEAQLRQCGKGRFTAFSAGSNPAGRVHTSALALMARHALGTTGYRSKGWQEFAAPGAPEMDLIVTLCNATAAEHAPDWPGTPLQVHWAIPDPIGAPADQIDLAFQMTYQDIALHIDRLRALPVETMSRQRLAAEIGALMPAL